VQAVTQTMQEIKMNRPLRIGEIIQSDRRHRLPTNIPPSTQAWKLAARR